jgi:hypothetical protein
MSVLLEVPFRLLSWRMLNFAKAFLTSIGISMCFFVLVSIYMYYIYSFTYVESDLNSWLIPGIKPTRSWCVIFLFIYLSFYSKKFFHFFNNPLIMQTHSVQFSCAYRFSVPTVNVSGPICPFTIFMSSSVCEIGCTNIQYTYIYNHYIFLIGCSLY